VKVEVGVNECDPAPTPLERADLHRPLAEVPVVVDRAHVLRPSLEHALLRLVDRAIRDDDQLERVAQALLQALPDHLDVVRDRLGLVEDRNDNRESETSVDGTRDALLGRHFDLTPRHARHNSAR
jgi:hypothetical protein